MGAPGISIIICTRDRAESLRETLISIGQCAVPAAAQVEVVVVDNASSDATATVIAAAKSANGLTVRRLWEAVPGLSRARNAALRETTSDVALFTDDDVRVPTRWVEEMCQPILDGAADAVAGGVHFPPAHERALSREPFCFRRGWFASTEGINAAHPTSIVGANMALSRRAINAAGSFDENLGAGALGFFEENFFIWKMLKAGLRLQAELGVSVEHHFELARLTRPNLLAMAARMGRSQAYARYLWGEAGWRGAKGPLLRARTLLFLHRLMHFPAALAGRVSINDLQRVQTAAYWSQLAAKNRV